MNILSTTSGSWLERGAVLFASTALLGGLAGADPSSEPSSNASETPEVSASVPFETALGLQEEVLDAKKLTFKEAFQQGRFWLNLRYRVENVDQDGFAKDATSSTLRTHLGYESAAWNNWTGLLEFSDVSTIGGGANSYNDTINGKTDRPVIADPTGTVVNQVYAKYAGLWESDIKFGRQRIKLDNDRFIGNVGWRQTEQVYDSVSFAKSDLASMNFFYAYVDHVNTIFGPNSTAGNLDANNHFFNLSKAWDNVGKLVGYAYYLDFSTKKSANSFTYGLRFDGSHAFDDKWAMLYTAEIAQQDDVAGNPNKISAGYLNGMLGAKFGGFSAKVAYESLEGADNTGGQFQTPLATAHAFQGWADKFLFTPQGGIEDLQLIGAYKFKEAKLLAVYHDFSAERGANGDYGTELDLQIVHQLTDELEIALKYADYSAKDFGTDTQKIWFWLYYKF